MSSTMKSGLCWAIAALQVTPEKPPSRHALSEIGTKAPLMDFTNSNGGTEHHHQPHKHQHAPLQNKSSHNSNSGSSSSSSTTTTNNAASITSSILAGVVDTVRGLADVASHSISSMGTRHSCADEDGVAADRENVKPTFRREEVADHCHGDSCWIIVNNRVYDVTRFLRLHPGGEDIILEYGGHDATSAFIEKGHSPDAFDMLGEYCIGEVSKTEWYPEINCT